MNLVIGQALGNSEALVVGENFDLGVKRGGAGQRENERVGQNTHGFPLRVEINKF
jgi:hypothetical protein